jgi:antitoxin Phd
VNSWQVHDAKARFSELLDTTIKKGPQVVTRRGIATAVLVPIDEWERMQAALRRGLKALLMAASGRTSGLAPERGHLRRRSPVDVR